jgi:hypothetical protein
VAPRLQELLGKPVSNHCWALGLEWTSSVHMIQRRSAHAVAVLHAAYRAVCNQHGHADQSKGRALALLLWPSMLDSSSCSEVHGYMNTHHIRLDLHQSFRSQAGVGKAQSECTSVCALCLWSHSSPGVALWHSAHSAAVVCAAVVC